MLELFCTALVLLGCVLAGMAIERAVSRKEREEERARIETEQAALYQARVRSGLDVTA